MLSIPRKYVVMVSKSWGRAISGPILAVVGLVLLLLQLTIHDSTQAELALKIGAWVTLGISALMIWVAQYEVWKQQKETTEQRDAELEKALLNGPELSLGFNNVLQAERFYIENRSKQDASVVSIDPFETPRYRAEGETLATVRHSEHPQILEVRMTDKQEHIQFVDFDIVEMLKDSVNGLQSFLEFTLRYRDSYGKRFKRRATLSVDRLRLSLNDLPAVVNQQIEIDRDSSEGH